MSSKQKNKGKFNPFASLARSLPKKVQKPSDSGLKANAKQVEGKDPQGSVHIAQSQNSQSSVSTTGEFARKCGAFLGVIGEVAGVSTADVYMESMEKDMAGAKAVSEYCGILAGTIEVLTKSNITEAMRARLENLRGELARMAAEDNGNIEDARWRATNYLQMLVMESIVTGSSADAFEKMEKRLLNISENVKEDALRQSITILPCGNAAYNDYTKSQKRVSCFKGTRQALLQEIIAWLGKPDSNVYVLFGLAGIGKSTIAQTVAETADKIHLLGASFFFSRDEEERRTARMFFTTIASQLCVCDPEFAKAIERVLSTEKGKGAIRKLPLEQLETLILDPLRRLALRKVVVVVDALDECDDKDAPTVLIGLNKLVKVLPSFKVVLTTRPQQHLQFLRTGQDSQKVFDLHDIEDKIVDDDIERYLRHKLSLEEVKACLPNLREPWSASDDEITSLVRAAGRLFIIASTAVLFILDKTSTPTYRMKTLLSALQKDHTPFRALSSFYTTILRNAVPESCEDDTKDRYQKIVGTIILIQQPLPVSALAKLIEVEVNEITIVLGNLQAVILLGSDDIPLTYHKSFPDYSARCKDEDLRIDPRSHHTRMATHCLRLMNRCLKQNILDLSDPARFTENGKAFEKQGLTEYHLQENIPTELRYACLYFSNHIGSADVEDTELAEELERFFNERFLNWLEALSWIGKLDSAHHTLLTVQKQLKLTSSELHQLVSDGLRFVWKFYQLIDRSALHAYHSALPATPTNTSLYQRYAKQMTFCQVQGGQESWDELISTFKSGSSDTVEHVVFSSDGTLLACCMHAENRMNGLITIHDAVAGIPLGRIYGQVFAIANDFSKAAAFDDGSITLYDVKGPTPIATIKPSETVVKLTISPDGSRLVAGLDDSSVCIWDVEKCQQVGSFPRWDKHKYGIAISSDGSRTAFTSCDGVIKLLDVTNGKIVADLEFRGLKQSMLIFSADGSRLACLSMSSLRVWESRDGALIGTAEDVGDKMAISTKGFRLVTGTDYVLKLFSGNNLELLEILDPNLSIKSIAIQNDLIGVASFNNDLVALYDVNIHTWIAWFPFADAFSLAFSPDCTRLAAGSLFGDVRLWDVSSITTSNTSSHGQLTGHSTVLAFSPDCSRLASGHEYGDIRLWDTTNMAEVASSPHKRHSRWVSALSFSVDGDEFASGSTDGVVKLWRGKDGAPRGVLECLGRVSAVAFSSSTVAASTDTIITLWNLKSRSVIATLDQDNTTLLTFSHHHSLLATAYSDRLTLWDTAKQESVTTFNVTDGVNRMTFLVDDSLLAVHGGDGDKFYLFDTHGSEASKPEASTNQNISRLNLCTSWHGIPVWSRSSGDIIGRFPQQEDDVTVFNCPSDFRLYARADGSAMIALGCKDGRILLIQVPSNKFDSST